MFRLLPRHGKALRAGCTRTLRRNTNQRLHSFGSGFALAKAVNRWSLHTRAFTSETEREKLPTDKLAIVFTCGKCDTRTIKQFSRSSYEQGVVLARCPGCEKYHVLADHKGWFGEKGTIEDILAERGESITSLTDEDKGLISPDELAGGKIEMAGDVDMQLPPPSESSK